MPPMTIDVGNSTRGKLLNYLKCIKNSNPNVHVYVFQQAMKGCSHNPTNQKGHWTTKKNNQNWINMYVLPFKAMAIMANYCFFIHINVKEFKPKIHLMKF